MQCEHPGLVVPGWITRLVQRCRMPQHRDRYWLTCAWAQILKDCGRRPPWHAELDRTMLGVVDETFPPYEPRPPLEKLCRRMERTTFRLLEAVSGLIKTRADVAEKLRVVVAKCPALSDCEEELRASIPGWHELSYLL